jgi:hypothetical protein
MKIIGMIPARGGSTRFNNKPLALICGKPMVYWVWKHSKEVACFDEVYVATDSEEIRKVAEGFGAKVLMTSSGCEKPTISLRGGCNFGGSFYPVEIGEMKAGASVYVTPVQAAFSTVTDKANEQYFHAESEGSSMGTLAAMAW